ncbi:hypothetical protein JNK13_01190 [bacterium]|nr:hypothetical protein [bacterium]
MKTISTEQHTAPTVILNVDTTIGDLICAIADAARESRIGDDDIASITHYIVSKMVRAQQKSGN